MALGISRTCIGGVLSHQGLSVRLACSSSSKVASSSTFSASGISHPRTYSTASATLTKKTPVTAKGTKNDAHAIPKPPKNKNAAIVPPKKATSPEMETALHVAATSPVASTVPPEVSNEAKQMDQLKEMERIMAFQHLMPTVDTWGQEVKETLDVQLPRPLPLSGSTLKTLLKSPGTVFETAKNNVLNSLKNAAALSTLISMNAVPGTNTPLGWKKITQSFATKSVKPTSVLSPVRDSVLEVYKGLNEAVANRNEKEVKRFSTASYQIQALELAKKFRGKTKNNKGRFIWQLHRTFSPVQILSLRVTEGYLAPEQPKFGNRLMIHALVKFDTEQSLEIYNEKGVPLHTAATETIGNDGAQETWRVPAPRKRVTEYLVMERRMWIPGTWQVREQLWPDLESDETTAK